MENFLRLNLLAAMLVCGAAQLSAPLPLLAQTGPATQDSRPEAVLATLPWEIGPVIQGGVGTGNRDSYNFFSAGAHLGKVLTNPALPSILRGQFELAGEFLPLWQAYTPPPGLVPVTVVIDGQKNTVYVPLGGGTFTGISITPVILRWNLISHRRLTPWVQGAGGVVWTNHKFPPDYLVPKGDPGGTSIWNFTPQFGVGFNYFVKPKRSISFAANAVHISSASLGDHNPGVNASVQFELGYNWWK